MKTEDLLPGEAMSLESDDKSVTLTTHRIRQEIKESGSHKIISIMLDQVSSSQMHRKSRPFFIVLAVIFVVIGIFASQLPGNRYNEPNPATPILLVLALIFGVLYLVSRSQVVTISSNSARIHFATKGMSKETVIKFINRVEECRSSFLKGMGK